jgi:hypothetical protein
MSVHEHAGLHWCTAGKQASTLSSYVTVKHLLEVEEQQMPF